MSGRMVATDVKLIPHRWAMHAIQAISNRDAGLLQRVFAQIQDLPEGAVNLKVKSFGLGAPMQFDTFGFYDEQSKEYGSPMVVHAIDGDTLLHLALRHHDPVSAAVLIKSGASVTTPNSVGEAPIQHIFALFCVAKLNPDANSLTLYGDICSKQQLDGFLQHQPSYQQLFELLHPQLIEYHERLKATIERTLEAIYAKHAPERLGKINSQMTEYEFRERYLLHIVQSKYDQKDAKLTR